MSKGTGPILTMWGVSRSVKVAMTGGSDKLTPVANTSIPVRNHTSMELEVFAHGGVVPLGGTSVGLVNPWLEAN